MRDIFIRVGLTNVFKPDKFRFSRDIGKNWFNKRVVDELNKLRRHVVSASTTVTLKNR